MSATDRQLLYFVAEHRLVLERQVARLSGTHEDDPHLRRRLGALADEECIRSDQVYRQTHYQIRKRGLLAIDSPLPLPKDKLASYKHDVGVAWLWLAAHAGTFGPLREVIGERRLRSHDGALEHPVSPYGVRLGGFDRYGKESLHYPDLLLIDERGRRLAIELELSSKGQAKRESILCGYAADRRIDRVLYLVEANPAGRGIRRALQRAVGAMGLAERIRFQFIQEFRVRPADREPASTRGARSAGRSDRARRPTRAARVERATEAAR